MLVLLDANMPDMDGFEVADRIKTMPEAAGLVVMMLSSRQYSDATRCRDAGLSAYLVKPVSASDLLENIGTTLSSAAQRADDLGRDVAPPADAAVRPRRILLAEDNAVNRQLARRRMRRRGHDVTVASTGWQAIEALDRSAFDLVLMDLQTPEMAGSRRRPSSAPGSANAAAMCRFSP